MRRLADLALVAALMPAVVLAQGASGSEGADGGAPTDTATPSATVTASSAPTHVAPSVPTAVVTTASKDHAADEVADHKSVVHRLAVGYLGVSTIPVAQGSVATLTQGSVIAPTLGVRYWAQEHVGIDLGVGFGFSSSSASQTAGGVTTSNTSPAVYGFALHGGLPIALVYSKHFTFEVIPEVHFAYAGTKVPGGGTVADTGLNGILFDLGGRIGAEVQFGFIGIPQLSLQGSIGVSFRYTNVWASQDTASASGSTMVLGTTIQNDPWAIFTNTIAALYYF